MVLIDADQKKAHGEAADIAHGRPFAHMMQIYAGDYSDVGDCGLIIITAGSGTETRREPDGTGVQKCGNI